MIGGIHVSAFVITYNEQCNIADCLEGLKWADELVVVDSFSQDRTVEIAGRYTERVVQREFAGYVAQMRYAAELTTCPWVMWLDADERLTPEAFAQVRREFERSGGPSHKGYAFPRKTFFMGRWIKHSGWYPQHKVRLFHRDFGSVGGEEPHSTVEMRAPTKNLDGHILHYSYPGGMADLVGTSTKYAASAARVRHQAGRRPSLLNLLLKPPGTFLKKYLLQLGVMDGLPGLAIAGVAAYYRFIREAMLWELDHPSSPPPAAGA